LQTYTEDLASDSYVFNTNSDFITAESYIAITQNVVKSISAESYIDQATLETIDSESYLLASYDEELQSDSFILLESPQTLTSDSYIIESTPGSINSDYSVKRASRKVETLAGALGDSTSTTISLQPAQFCKINNIWLKLKGSGAVYLTIQGIDSDTKTVTDAVNYTWFKFTFAGVYLNNSEADITVNVGGGTVYYAVGSSDSSGWNIITRG
jgi:hypothetical protein